MNRAVASEMLDSIAQDNRPWLIAPDTVVQRSKGMWYILGNWSVGKSGLVIHKQEHKKGLIAVIEEVLEELG